MKNKILLVIFVISLISSFILVSINSNPDSTLCEIGGGGSCHSVQGSKYAYSFGISNSVYGVFIFAILSILVFSQIMKPKNEKQLIIDSAVIVGFLIALYFIFLQIFVIKDFCKYCLIIDIGLIIAFLLVVQKKSFNFI